MNDADTIVSIELNYECFFFFDNTKQNGKHKNDLNSSENNYFQELYHKIYGTRLLLLCLLYLCFCKMRNYLN